MTLDQTIIKNVYFTVWRPVKQLRAKKRVKRILVVQLQHKVIDEPTGSH